MKEKKELKLKLELETIRLRSETENMVNCLKDLTEYQCLFIKQNVKIVTNE